MEKTLLTEKLIPFATEQTQRVFNADFVGGVILAGLGVIALWSARDLAIAGDFGLGVGTFPRGLALALIVSGFVVAGIGLVSPKLPLPHLPWRGPLFVTAALVSFGIVVQGAGLFLTSFVCFLLSCLGSTETRWLEATVAGFLVSALCVLVFLYGLGLPFPLLPSIFR